MKGMRAALFCSLLSILSASSAYSLKYAGKEKEVPDLDILQQNINDDFVESKEETKGLKERWEIDDENVQNKGVGGTNNQVKGLLEKWMLEDEELARKKGREENDYDLDKNLDSSVVDTGGKKSLLEQWKVEDENLVRRKGLKESMDSGRVDTLELTESKEEPKLLPQRPVEQNGIQSNSFKKNLLKHLRDIARAQTEIISILEEIEQKSEGNSKCSLRKLAQQIAAMAELKAALERESTFVESEPLPIRKYSDTKRSRFHRSVLDTSPHTNRLLDKLALAKAKRARITKLIQELNNFRDLQLTENEAGDVAVSSLQLQLCEEVNEQTNELEKITKQLKGKVTETRQHVIKQLTDLLMDESLQQVAVESDNSTSASIAIKVINSAKKLSNANSTIKNVNRTVSISTISKPVRVAGRVNKNRCELCEELDNEEVCGDNGKTYRTLCHAVNCAGLALRDIAIGSCITKDVCAHSECDSRQICIPMVHGTCLALYSSDGFKKIPCHQYICAKKNSSCETKKFSEVCGGDGITYNSLCELHKAGQQLAYTGACRPLLCKGEVCGTDKNTYKSACHARASNAKVDYSGKCFSMKPRSIEPQFSKHVSTCALIRKIGRCQKEALCNKPILPIGACCPICGGIAQVALNNKALTEFISLHEDKNHLYVLENVFRDILPPYAVRKCDISGSMTDTGNVSLILEAVNPGDHQLCQDALRSMTNAINRNKSLYSLQPKFEIAAFINLESWFRNQVVDIQDQILSASDDLKNKAQVKLGETVQGIDNKVQALPSGGNKVVVSVDAHILILTLTFLVLLQQ